MVEAGDLKIGGSIDTSNIESGLRRVGQGFDDLQSKTGGINADFERFDKVAGAVTKKLVGLGIVGTASIFALAKGSPALAGSMAKLNVEVGELSREMGRQLAPAAERLVERFAELVDWIGRNDTSIGIMTGTVESFASALFIVAGLWEGLISAEIPLLDITIGEGLRELIDEFGAAGVLGLVGMKIGKKVGARGAGLGLGVAVGLVGGEREKGGVGATEIGAGVGATLGLVGGPPGIFAGAGIGAIIGKAIDIFSRSTTRKNIGKILQDWF